MDRQGGKRCLFDRFASSQSLLVAQIGTHKWRWNRLRNLFSGTFFNLKLCTVTTENELGDRKTKFDDWLARDKTKWASQEMSVLHSVLRNRWRSSLLIKKWKQNVWLNSNVAIKQHIIKKASHYLYCFNNTVRTFFLSTKIVNTKKYEKHLMRSETITMS